MKKHEPKMLTDEKLGQLKCILKEKESEFPIPDTGFFYICNETMADIIFTIEKNAG